MVNPGCSYAFKCYFESRVNNYYFLMVLYCMKKDYVIVLNKGKSLDCNEENLSVYKSPLCIEVGIVTQ